MEFLTLFLILGGALALLITERLSPDAVGLGIVAALILTGAATVPEATAGFVHPAVLTVAGLFLLSAGVQRTGVTDRIAVWMRQRRWESARSLLRLQSGVVAAISMFVSNTVTVAVFLPVTLSITRSRGFPASRFLIPLSFASLLGGMCTVLGTSTNVVVSGIAADHGLRPLGMFEFFPVGIVLAVLGILYLVTVGQWLLPERTGPRDLASAYRLRRYLTEVEIVPGSSLAGTVLGESGLSETYDLDVLEIHRGTTRLRPDAGTRLAAGDVLLVRASLATIQAVQEAKGVRIRSEAKVETEDLLGGGTVLAEAVVPPGSPLAGRSLKEAAFRNRHGVTALGLVRRRECIRERVGKIPLEVGDTLLLWGPHRRIRALAARPEVLSVVQTLPPRPRRRLAMLSLVLVGLTVAAAALGWVSLMKAVVGGAALMVITGCLPLRETYRAVDWRTVLLLAGMVSLGMTMERAGAAEYLARHVMEQVAGWGPVALLSATFLVTMVLTELVTNNACAVIMTPLAIATARDFGLDPRPFVFTVAFAASASFLTPFGYQTNLFVYGPGGYKFRDFARVGLPLSLMTWLVVTWMVPRLWPLVP